MLEERDAKIRELEATIKALQEKLGACDRSENNIINEKTKTLKNKYNISYILLATQINLLLKS